MLKSPLIIIMIKASTECMFSITICQTPWCVFYKYSVLYSQPYYMVWTDGKMGKVGLSHSTKLLSRLKRLIHRAHVLNTTERTNDHGTQAWGSTEEAESRVKDDTDCDAVLTLNSVFDGLQASAGKGGCETRVRGLLGNKRASKFLLNLEEPEAGRAKKGQVQILP